MATLRSPEPVWFDLGDITLAGQRWGNNDSPLVLALHGWLDNSNSFADLGPRLVAEGFQVIALDWPGHGQSDHRPAGVPYQLLDYLFDLHRLVSRLNQPLHLLLGHSMGGILAQLYAGLYPDEVPALATIEAIGPLVAENGSNAERLRSGFASRVKLPSPTETGQGGYEDISALVKARARAGHFSDSQAELLLGRNLQQCNGRWYWRSDPRLRQRSAWMMTAEQAREYLAGYDKPSLLVLGQQGYEILKANLAKRRDWFHQLTVTEIPGGHHCHMESGQILVQTLMAYLAGKSLPPDQ